MFKFPPLYKLVKAVFTTTAIAFLSQSAVVTTAHAQAGVFEVVHPDVEQGEVEFEVLNGLATGSLEEGEERSVHELAIGYGFTDYWKLTAAVEIANPAGESAEVEGYEFESLLLLAKGAEGHDSEEDGEGHHGPTLGLFAALEVPREGGISEGAFEFGPVWETELGEFEFVGNLLVEVPFAGGEDAGLAYASQLIMPTDLGFDIGVENFGEFEGLFGERGEDMHFAGPGIYWEAELSNGHKIEPRIAVLFGLNDETPDTTISFNIEYKIGQN